MNHDYKVYGVLIFGIVMTFLLPHIVNFNQTQSLKESTHVNTTENTSQNIAMNTEDHAVPVTPALEKKEKIKEETPKVEPEVKQEVPEVVETATPIVFDGLTMEELIEKLNRSLHGALEGTGSTFAKYSVEMGINPYLAIGIVLLETGCNGTCSAQVRQCNNVGGMKGSPGCNGTSYKKFETLEAGIYSFMLNLKTNYYDKGLTTAEAMNKKYAASTSWSAKVNKYAAQIKAA